ncbi:hypothetical protein AK830_g10867 [Neonectria ditissima]|uniref:Heterokaryon incompatibility domain-containing protein n=1 Tax=Neonectria ditissima TaxID=78410 RepID=A0A0N8H5B6_9HYPO|nr:hypothetical protein AK830_g10867 [Neonectria ditissima]
MGENSTERQRPLTVPPEYQDCHICQCIWRRFSDPDFNDEINMGSFASALSSGCPTHTPLVQSFQDYCEGDPDNKLSDYKDVGIIVGEEKGVVVLHPSVSRLGLIWELLLAERPPRPEFPATRYGRIMDPNWADIDRLKEWKQRCLELHGPKCENPSNIWKTRPAWLIDVRHNCIVPGADASAFVALSYTWGSEGNHSSSVVNLDTIDKLQVPNALDNPEVADHVSPMIRHAMFITSYIGERYLWADALCIPHGAGAKTTEQLHLMGAIYSNATVTIIASDGDAQSGLPGLRGVSPPRALDQRIIPFGEEKLIVRNTGYFSMGSGTPYYQRGWTYQEYAMSPRKILMNRKELHWECQCSVWHEELTLDSTIDTYINPRLAVIASGFPDMESFSHTVHSYNERELTFPEDALPGILGLLGVFSRSFTGGFLYGLPEMQFDRCLGWKPYWGFTNLERRVKSDRPPESRLTPSDLPSWSWIGWQGLLNVASETARINTRKDWIEETTPVTDWYTSSSAKGSHRRRIHSTWYEDREKNKDFTKPLPPGWTRHDASSLKSFRDEPPLFPDGCGKFIFKHDGLPDKDCDSWFYPFPVAEITESTPPLIPEQTPYLFCETKMARLWARQREVVEDEYTGFSDKNIIGVHDSAGEQVGTLQLHHEDQLASFPEATGHDGPGTPVQLVAIYKSRQYSLTWNRELRRYDNPMKIEDSYGVLWVEWEDGIACRLASGNVEKDSWEASTLEDVSLVLR